MRVILLLVGDVIAIMLSSFFALWIRYELVFADIDRNFLESIWGYAGINIICTIAIFYVFHLYTSLWKYASVNELVNITLAVNCIRNFECSRYESVSLSGSEKL